MTHLKRNQESGFSGGDSKGLNPTGMDYPAELTVRLMMAAAVEDKMIAKVYKEFSKNPIKETAKPVEVHDDAA